MALAEGTGDVQQSAAPAAPVEKPEPEIVYVEVPVENHLQMTVVLNMKFFMPRIMN